jgi:tRNA1(Val) A37 N6-methylase TrmN6
VLAALAGRFGSAEIVPVHATGERPAIRIVVRAVRGARGVPSLLPPLFLQEGAEGRFTARAEAINCGQAALFDD